MQKSWTLEVKDNHNLGEPFVELNDEILKHLNAEEGDTLEWIDNHDGSFTLKKKVDEPSKELVWVMVEAVQTFRQRYVVQVPKNFPEWALDTVSMEEAKEFSQLYLGETIISHRTVTEEEALKMCNEDNEYCKTWADDQKMAAFFTREGEKVKL